MIILVVASKQIYIYIFFSITFHWIFYLFILQTTKSFIFNWIVTTKYTNIRGQTSKYNTIYIWTNVFKCFYSTFQAHYQQLKHTYVLYIYTYVCVCVISFSCAMHTIVISHQRIKRRIHQAGGRWESISSRFSFFLYMILSYTIYVREFIELRKETRAANGFCPIRGFHQQIRLCSELKPNWFPIFLHRLSTFPFPHQLHSIMVTISLNE